MSVGGRMRGGKSDKEVCACACASVCAYVCVCVLIPGRTSSDSELLGSSVGVPDIDTGKRGREKEEKKERERYKRVRGIKGSSTVESHTYTLTRRGKTTHRERLR